MPEPQTPQEKINPDQYKKVGELEYKGQYLALLHNPKAKADQWLSAEMFLSVRYWRFEAYSNEQEAREGFIERFHDMIHPIIQAEREWAEKSKDIPLLTADDCIPGSSGEDYTGMLMIVRPENLTAQYRYPEYQYFLARYGNGCNPDGHGTKVYGTYLYDGEESQLRRQSFYGAADPAKLPDWLKLKLAAQGQAEAQTAPEDREGDAAEI